VCGDRLPALAASKPGRLLGTGGAHGQRAVRAELFARRPVEDEV